MRLASLPSLATLPFLVILLCLAARCGPSVPPPLADPPATPNRAPTLAVVGGRVPARGRPLFSRFIANRDDMHAYLYNGDELFPKHVNLCSRGRNALLDLDLGPGASHDLGLFGPAWEAHLFAVAVDLDPRRPWHRAGRTRFLYSWPVVSTGAFDVLEAAHRLGVHQRNPAAPWSASAPERARLRLRRFRAVRRGGLGGRRRPRLADRAAARTWARRVKIAWLDRLGFSALALAPPALGPAATSRARWEQLASRALGFDARSLAVLRRIEHALTAAARRRGLLFDARRYRRFHARHLRASLGSGWRFGRVTADQLGAIIAHLEGRPDSRSKRWLSRARLEHARLEYLRHGRRTAGLSRAVARYGKARIERVRQQYVELKAEIERVRKNLTARARKGFDAQVRRRLHAALQRGADPLLAGSFYFQTEHLLETSSGFTHVGLIKRLPDPRSGRPLLWMFDRVLGFHYAYPVVRLTNSVPVQVLALSKRRRGPRRYRWLRLRVPSRFQLGRGQHSDQVTLLNLLTHVKTRLQGCARLWISPGLYYAGVTWIINHPRNRLTLADLWQTRVHTGYAYRSLDPRRLQRLKGRTLYIPVRERLTAPWSQGCPPRTPGANAAPGPAGPAPRRGPAVDGWRGRRIGDTISGRGLLR